jgi:5-methylcytosine-specific restriction endonuclease McrA
VLYKRDKGICQLCLKRCTREDASRDHVIPISEGGEHSYKNCVLAHLRCNSSKGNRKIAQQQRLF